MTRRIDSRRIYGGMSDYEREDWTQRAVRMEAGLLRKVLRHEPYAVPSNELHYSHNAWCMSIDEAKGPVKRWESRGLLGGLTPVRGMTFRGYDAQGAAANAVFLDPTGVEYPDPKAETFRKLKKIRDGVIRDLRNTGTTAVSWVNIFAAGPVAILFAANFDKFWGGYLNELGDGFDAGQLNAADQRAHQEFRGTDRLAFSEPIVDSFDGLFSLGSGKGFDWGYGRDTSNYYAQHAPVNWIQYVILPRSFFGPGVQPERFAPNGYRYTIETVPDDETLPADAVDLDGVTVTDPGAGSVSVDADTYAIKLVSSGTDYDTGFSDDARTFTPEVGESFMCEFTYPAATKIAVGMGDAAGVTLADVKWGLSVDTTGAVTVRHHNGSTQTTRAFAAFNLAANESYRLRWTWGTGGVAYVQLQSTKNPGGSQPYHQIGERDWWDLLEGTAVTNTGMPTGVRMKASVGGTAATYYLLARPRIVTANATVPSAVGHIWRDSLLRPIGCSDASPFSYPRTVANARTPDRAGTAAFSAVSGATEIAFCNAAGNRQPASTTASDLVPAGLSRGHAGGYNADPLIWNPGVADVICEAWYKPLRNVDNSHWLYLYFNSDSTRTNHWMAAVRLGDGLCLIKDQGGTQTTYTTIGSGYLGAYSADLIIRVRLTCNGNAVKLEITEPDGDFVTAIDTTIASRLYSTQTYVGLSANDLGIWLGDTASTEYGFGVRRA